MGDSAGAPVAAKAPSLLANRSYRRLWLGQAISLIGDFVFDTTLVVWIAADLARGQTWAPLAVSGVLIAALLPVFLVGPFAGVFVDRADKRRLMLAMDAARAVLILLLVAGTGAIPLPLLAGGALSLVQRLALVYAIVFLASACSQFFGPARLAIIRDVVAPEQIAQAFGIGRTTQAVATIVGPPLAAPVLFAFGPQWALLINAASFLISFAAVAGVRVRPEVSQATASVETQRESFVREWGRGVRFFFSSRVLATLLLIACVTTLSDGALNTLGIFFVQRNLHAPVTLYGFMDAALAVGAIAGSALGGAFGQRIGLGRVVWAGLFAAGALIVVFSRTTSFEVAGAVWLLAGIPIAMLNVAIGPLIFSVTPKELLGRVLAILTPVMTACTLISMGLSSYLASGVLRDFSATAAGLHFTTYDTIFGIAGLLTVLSGFVALAGLRGGGGSARAEQTAAAA